MSQISPPVRILLIGAVVFLAAWFTFLRPKAEEVPPTTTTTTTTPAATPETGLGKAVDAARKVAGKAAATATPASTTGQATTSAPDAKPAPAAITAVPAEALAKLPKDVAGALKARQVLVLGVLSEDAKPWRPLADDDRYVRNALSRVNRYDGQVFVKPVGLDRLSSYGTLVNDLGVDQSPSIVVIDRNLKGTVLTGYVDKVSINQAIADARRNSISPNIKDAYLRQANRLCGDTSLLLGRWSLPTIRGKKALTASYVRRAAILKAFEGKVGRLAAPAKWRGLKAAWLKDVRADRAAMAGVVTAAKTGKVSKVNAAIRSYNVRYDRSLDRRFNEAGLTDCAAYRSL